MPRGTGKDLLKYLNYYNNKEELITDSVYQNHLSLIDIDKTVRDLFYDSRFNLRKVNSSGTSSKDVYELTGEDIQKKYYISVYLIKNSGQANSRKRIQIVKDYFGLIGNNDLRPENEEYFFLGLYPLNDKGECIYVLLDNDGFSLNPQKAYSSLWIDYEALKATAINGCYFGINRRNGNKYFSFKKEYKDLVLDFLENDDYSSLIKNERDIHILDEQGRDSHDETIFVEDYVPSRDAVVTFEGKAKIKKNSALREVAFTNAHYTCTLCGKTQTFITNNQKMYFEAHHLIPCNINIQKRFTKKLDHTVNLYCLCPECHRKIHLINNQEIDGLIDKLFSERKDKLIETYNLTVSELISIYSGIDRKDEDNM